MQIVLLKAYIYITVKATSPNGLGPGREIERMLDETYKLFCYQGYMLTVLLYLGHSESEEVVKHFILL